MHLLEKINNYLSLQSKNQLNKGQRVANSIDFDEDLEADEFDIYSIIVPSENGIEFYTVDIDDTNPHGLIIDCDCIAYDEYGDCKHCVAAALIVKEELLKKPSPLRLIDFNKKLPVITDGEGYYHFKMDDIVDYTLQKLAGYPSRANINKAANKIRPVDVLTAHQQLVYFERNKPVYNIDIVYDGGNGFKTRCSCNEKEHPLCIHVMGAFTALEYLYNRYYFRKFKDFTADKNKLLAPYGLTVNDPEAADFEWNVSPWGELTIKSKPAYLIKAGNAEFLQGIKNRY